MAKDVKIRSRPARQQPSADNWVESRAGLTDAAQEIPITKRMTFNLDQDLHAKLKLHCVHRDVTMADLIRELIERELGGIATSAE